jgi:uncharacterized protein
LSVAVLASLAAVGVAAGFLAGLVGIGGGVLMVPFLYFFYAHAAWSGVSVPAELHVTLAHATSLFIIVPTAVLGTISYARAGLVSWHAALPIAVASLIGAQLGVALALLAPGELLQLAFGTLLLFYGVQLARRRAPRRPAEAVPTAVGEADTSDGGSDARTGSVVALGAVGLLVGAVSALMGVGGGLVAVPLLIHVARIGIRRVAATSLAIVCFAAPAGAIAYIVRGWGETGLPPGSAGYVHVVAAVPMLLGSLVAVRLGTRVNQAVETETLRRIFAAALMVLGVRLVVASWRWLL